MRVRRTSLMQTSGAWRSTGREIHSKDYKRPDDLEGARMLVGVSETMRRIALGRRALRAFVLANRLTGHPQPVA
jgi:hypothetical protein